MGELLNSPDNNVEQDDSSDDSAFDVVIDTEAQSHDNYKDLKGSVLEECTRASECRLSTRS